MLRFILAPAVSIDKFKRPSIYKNKTCSYFQGNIWSGSFNCCYSQNANECIYFSPLHLHKQYNNKYFRIRPSRLEVWMFKWDSIWALSPVSCVNMGNLSTPLCLSFSICQWEKQYWEHWTMLTADAQRTAAVGRNEWGKVEGAGQGF